MGEGGQPESQWNLVIAQVCIDALGTLFERFARRSTYRLKFGYPSVCVFDRGDKGADPVVVTILAAVLDRPHPAFSLLDVVPHICKGLFGHIRMAHQIVMLTS